MAPDTPGESVSRREWLWVALLLVLGLVIRASLVAVQQAESMDQVLYCNDARNLLEGRWTYEFPNENNFYVLQPSGLSAYNRPLYPVLMAGVAAAVGSVERAGLIVSFLAGLASLFIFHRIVRALLGPPWALAALAVASTSSALSMASATKYAESTYILLALLSAWALVAAARSGGSLWALLSGVALGLAALTKPEAGFLVVPFTLTCLVGALRAGRGVPRSLAAAGLFAAAALLVPTPYRLYFLRETGSAKPVGKSLYNFIAGSRREEGMTHAKAFWELNADATDTILSERSRTEKLRDLILPQALPLAGKAAENGFRILSGMFPPPGRLFAGAVVLGGIGALIGSWRRRRDDRYQLAAIAGILACQLIPFSVVLLHSRALVALVPAVTIAALAVARYYAPAAWRLKPSHRSFMAIAAVAMTCVVLFALQFPKTLAFVQAGEIMPEVGKWLAANTPPDAVIMSRSPAPPYYARRRQVILPEDTAERIHQYALHKGADFVVTESQDKSPVASDGVRFEVLTEMTRGGQCVQVFRVLRPAQAGSPEPTT